VLFFLGTHKPSWLADPRFASVCRRQGGTEAERIMRTLASGGLKLVVV